MVVGMKWGNICKYLVGPPCIKISVQCWFGGLYNYLSPGGQGSQVRYAALENVERGPEGLIDTGGKSGMKMLIIAHIFSALLLARRWAGVTYFFLTRPAGSRYIVVIIISLFHRICEKWGNWGTEVLHKALKDSWLVSSFWARRLGHYIMMLFYPKWVLLAQGRKILWQCSGSFRRRGRWGAHCCLRCRWMCWGLHGKARSP